MLLLTLLACSTPPDLPVLSAEEMRDPATLELLTRRLADPAWRGRDEGTAQSAAIRDYLIRQLEACGVQPAGERGFEQHIRTGLGTNVIGGIDGTDPSLPAVVLSAHYDHQSGGVWTHPGAYDNATSVAVLLQTACRLALYPPRADVIIAAWDAEEPPTFRTDAMGSRYWHANPTVPLSRVSSVIVLDLLGSGLWDGYPGVFALGSETSETLHAAVGHTRPWLPLRVHQAGLHLVEEMVIGPSMAWSDYEVFRDHNIPVVFLTDGQNKRYHTPDDTADAVDYDKLKLESEYVYWLVRRIADGPAPTWSPRPRPDQDTRVVRELLKAALDKPRWGATSTSSLQSALDELNSPTPSVSRTQAQRVGAQRLMCWAGPQASVFTCGML